MSKIKDAPNRLINEKSPYLLQHAYNSVDWFPWCEEAFEKAKNEDKPIFLSIGYSTCHWCHVMAHESFESAEVADILNRDFISVKVDKEERPDIDSVYMSACMALTGSGGWPTTILTDADRKPFFAGTYFPKNSRYGMTGLIELLEAVRTQWKANREKILDSAEKISSYLNEQSKETAQHSDSAQLTAKAVAYFRSAFDTNYGGFGRAPKFPSPHNLLFLMEAYQRTGDSFCLEMAEKTLSAMAKGGIFDHIGFGFSRYSTDEKWLAPHFEKMLYDNALLLMAYTKAYELTKNPIYKIVAEKTIRYIEREMTRSNGGFYSAQDADSDGVEGKYYLFTQAEVIAALGETDGQAFCAMYDITPAGNFEGTNIPNQIGLSKFNDSLAHLLPTLYEYRQKRTSLHKDDKILTAWNGLMIAALADASVAFGNEACLDTAKRAAEFIQSNLCRDEQVFTSFRDGERSGHGFLDDYACYIYALLRLYSATPEACYLDLAKRLAGKTLSNFFDEEHGGFYLTGNDGEVLFVRPKESYDGAVPSGNSVMAMNLVLLNLLTGEYTDALARQMDFMASRAAENPGAHSFFLYSLLRENFSKSKVTDYICDEHGCRLT